MIRAPFTRGAVLAAVLASAPALGAAPGANAPDDLGKKVQAAGESRGPEVSIPFADRGGILDWRAIGRDTLLVQGTGNRWYRVELFGPCFELPFVERVGFNANPTGDFDRFSAVIVRGQRCAVKSVTASAPPPPPARKSKADAAKPSDAGKPRTP